MKEKGNKFIIFGVLAVIILGFIIFIIINSTTSKTYNCQEIINQANLCWENKDIAAQDIVECWVAPSGYENICEGEEIKELNYHSGSSYSQCDELRISYTPPSMFFNMTLLDPSYESHIPPEGQIFFECPDCGSSDSPC